MKKGISKKLHVQSETLRQLGVAETAAIVGGISLHTFALNCIAQTSNC
jgi:hypothetical protein